MIHPAMEIMVQLLVQHLQLVTKEMQTVPIILIKVLIQELNFQIWESLIIPENYL